MNYFDLGKRIHEHKKEFILVPQLWINFSNNPISKELVNINWSEFKFLNDDNSNINAKIQLVPKNKGGIYFFYIRCPVLGRHSEYLAYIGRAYITKHQSLNRRLNTYFYNYMNDTERPKIFRMMELWRNHLYVKYIEFDDNDTIKELEKSLIKSILPPFNDDIPDKKIKKAVKAFS